MKITHVMQSIANPSAGPTYSVGEICNYLSSIANNDVSILALGNYPKKWTYMGTLNLFNSYFVSYGLIPVRALISYIDLNKIDGSIIHEHGVWRVVNLLPLIKKNTKVKLIWSPRGMFSRWSMNHHFFFKLPFWFVLQKPALRKSDCFHATCNDEALDIRRNGFKQPIALIPNGVNAPDLNLLNPVKTKQILFLGRIHTVKGVHILINSWKAISKFYYDWNLVIAGDLDSAYANEMQALICSSKIPRVKFVGGVFGEEKSKLLANSRIFVLPSYSENFGIAVAEALAHGTPVITTVHTPWKGMIEHECGWCIETDEQALTDTLSLALNLPEEQLDKMGRNGREWMIKDFSWEKQATEMQKVYEWLVNKADRPDCVLVD